MFSEPTLLRAATAQQRMLVFDVEGTLFRPLRLPGTSIGSSMWQAIAEALGPDAVSAEIETHRQWERKKYRNYLEWMEVTVAIHKKYNLSHSTFRTIVQRTEYNEYVQEVFDALDRDRFIPVLVSGGFRELAAKAQTDLTIRHAFAACEYLFDRNGSLNGFNLLPCDFEGKIDFIKLMLRELGCADRDWVFVGDDKNDVAVARAAPVSVAYRGVPELKAVTTHTIDDFRALIPILNSMR